MAGEIPGKGTKNNSIIKSVFAFPFILNISIHENIHNGFFLIGRALTMGGLVIKQSCMGIAGMGAAGGQASARGTDSKPIPAYWIKPEYHKN
jgi:hypothetical protein